ncbi:MAG: 2-succinyl-5-enolpyruvyl-6-hydroxy-3-cyclohexene-1-carboxylic-acid synthase [Flavobacteriaceae bacterium]|nr:2-succinyl-5-enolpyruvyl-6-hydroxy-3-cyclohexene-1-carboxylic-acid synthase [Flavobacteriaceae bacterium]
MIYSKIPLAQTITQLCFIKEIRNIVICPGSRNAPLTICFTENPFFNVYSIVDERAAAFFALGIAQQTGTPTAVICTSGSAVLNFYPAIAEAYYSDIPLIVISADRPSNFIDIGDGQTIRQEHVFEKHILYSANLKPEETHQDYNEIQINSAINISIELKGPVHINAPFDEPLYEKTNQLLIAPQNVPVKITKNEIDNEISEYVDLWNCSRRKLILIGVLPPNSLQKQIINQLASDDSVLVLTETTSNVHHTNFICSIDQLIAPLSDEEFKELQPNILISFGGMVISKKVKAFLRTFPAKHHWHIDEKKAYDTYFYLKKHFKVSPQDFFESFLPKVESVPSDYQTKWLSIKKIRERKHLTYLEKIPFSDLKVFELILKAIPKSTILQLSNSAIVRYAQLFTIDQSLKVFCNRGTSGIDGSTSTAIGAAVASNQQVTFITGDLSFFYDANALWNNYIPKTFRIILINNNGGGIFRILPGEKNTPNFETFFETVHDFSAKQLCEMHQIDYRLIVNQNELESQLTNFYSESQNPVLLEIKTPRTENDTILLNYFKQLT